MTIRPRPPGEAVNSYKESFDNFGGATAESSRPREILRAITPRARRMRRGRPPDGESWPSSQVVTKPRKPGEYHVPLRFTGRFLGRSPSLPPCRPRPCRVLSLAPAPARAAFEFANFNLVNANQAFAFTNNTTFATISANTQVTFNFTAQSGLGTQDHSATLSLSGSTFTPATSLGGGFVDQIFSQLSTLHITENGTGKNLLTLQFTDDLFGKTGSPTASIQGADTNGNIVNYTSDFLAFTASGNSFNLGLNTVSPALSIGPGGFLNSFIANVNGQFTGNATPAAVPEPSSLVLCGLAGLVGLGYSRARRKAA